MIDWSKISDTSKYVIEGDDAKRVYDALQMSYVGRNKTMPASLIPDGIDYKLEYKYEDELLYIEERVVGGRGGYFDEILFFLVYYDSDSLYFLSEHCEDGVPLTYSIKDDTGKYFVRPPKTEYELQKEAEERKLMEDCDLPF